MSTDFTSLQTRQDPYPFYAELREHAPVSWVNSLNCWAVSRYADVRNVLLKPKEYSSKDFVEQLMGDLAPVKNGRWIIALDAPEHSSIRVLANRAFTPQVVAGLAPMIQQEVDEWLDQIPPPDAAGSSFELYEAFTSIFPVSVIARMLGVPKEDGRQFRRWTEDVNRAHWRSTYDEEQIAAIRRSSESLGSYVDAAIERYRHAPGHNIISDLIRAEEDGKKLTSLDVLCLAVFFLQAGTDSTGLLIGNTLVELGRRPELAEQIYADPDRLGPFIDEVLRFNPAIQALPRTIMNDVTLHGVEMKAGQSIVAIIASANRDPERFERPDMFDPTRDQSGSLSFGYGHHACLGRALAREEAIIAVKSMMARWRLAPRIEEVRWMENWVGRGPVYLPVGYAAH